MDLLQKDVPILAKIYEAKCFYDSRNNRIILYYKNHVTARTLVDFYNLPTTPPPNSSLYVIYDLQTGTFNVSTDRPTYTVSNSKVYVTSPINAEYDMDKVIIYRISSYELDTDIDLNHILTQLNTMNTDLSNVRTQLDTFVRKQQADTITAIHTFNPTAPGPAFQLGPNAQNQLIRYLNADKVDGFDVSQTPAPNMLVPLDANGVLDLSQTYVKSNVYTFRRVNLTNATSDYNLQVGEEAYIEFSDTTHVPLRIAVSSNALYWLYCNAGGCFLNPNNMSYQNSFKEIDWGINFDGTNAYVQVAGSTFSSFTLGNVSGAGVILSYIDISKAKTITQHISVFSTSPYSIRHMVSHWVSPVAWTSLGTLSFLTRVSGIVLIRRLA